MRRFLGQLVIVRDVTGSCFEGVFAEILDGVIPEFSVTNCRQINWQDATKKPLSCEWWEVGDQVFHAHHVVGIHPTNLVPR